MTYVAIAELKAYLFDLFVWGIIGGIFFIILFTILKRSRLFIIVLGTLLLLSAVPIGVMSEISINGCCGAPSTGREGLGFALGACVGLVGILVLIFSKQISHILTRK